MIKSRYIFLGLAMILMLAGCGANRKTIRFGAAGIGGMYDSFANAYVSLANKEDFSYKLETRNTAGSAANVRLLSGKYIELGIAQADLVEEAYHGTGEFRDKAYQGYTRSNLASMGIYIFSWKALKESLTALKDQPSCDFGKHILPYCRDNGKRLFAYEFNGYWKDVGTLGSYWEANMELIDIIPEFNLYEEFWKIYTKGDIIRPQYVSGDAVIDRCIIGEGAEIYGEVHNSVIGADVRIEKGVVVRDSIIMRHSTIGEGTQVNKAIIAENVHVGKHVVMGVGEEAPNVLKPNIYGFGLVTVGEKAVIPDGVTIGKNVCISGETSPEDYPDGTLPSGGAIVEKDGE